MAAYRRVYDSRHLQADCQEPGSAPEPFAWQSSMGYLFLINLLITSYCYCAYINDPRLKSVSPSCGPRDGGTLVAYFLTYLIT